MSWECGDPYSGIGCPVPGCTHDPKGWPESATMTADPTPRTDPTAAAVRAAQAEALYAAAKALNTTDHATETALGGVDRVIDWLMTRAARLATDTAAPEGEVEWFEGGDGHGYRYQYIGPIHYLCECGAYFLNRDRWIAHKSEQTPAAPVAVEGVETVETLAEVLAEHELVWDRRVYPEFECSCGEWHGALGDDGSETDGQNDNAAGFRAHLAARIVQARAGEGALRERIEAIPAQRFGFLSGDWVRLADLRAALDPEATT